MASMLTKWYHPDTTDTSSSKRDAYMDNLRAVLIIFVVTGHFLGELDSFDRYRYLSYFIYTFHMPCFVFVSGYFAKNAYRNGNFRSDKVISLFWIYILFKLATYLISSCFRPMGTFFLLRESGAPWYLLALCLWYLLIPILRNYKARYVLPITIIIGLLAGLDTSIATMLSLSRVLVFLPYFCAGFYLSDSVLKKIMNLPLRIPAILIFFTSLYLMLSHGAAFAPFVRILYGASSYPDVLGTLKSYGCLFRLLWYAGAVILSLSLMYLIPRCRMWFTYIGQRTLGIYFLHLLIRNLLSYLGFFTWLSTTTKAATLLIFPLSLLVTFLCANRYIERAFRFIMDHPFFIKIRKI